jgi:hypothetical protein
METVSPSRNRCFICGDNVKLDQKYCSNCETVPKCPSCFKKSHMDGILCDECIELCDPRPSPTEIEFMSKLYRGNNDTDKYVIKYPKNPKNTSNDDINTFVDTKKRNSSSDDEVITKKRKTSRTKPTSTRISELGTNNTPKIKLHIISNKSNNPSDKLKENDILKMLFDALENSNKDEEETKTSGKTVEDRSQYPYKYLGEPKTLDDIIKLGKSYNELKQEKFRHSLNIETLYKLSEPLSELQTMIGLYDIKDDIFQQIVFNLLDLEKQSGNMWHTVIQGAPGVGKTAIANILAKIYCSFSIIKRAEVYSYKLNDLIAEYTGQTPHRTMKKLNEAKGGIILLDEAYTFGDKQHADTFTKQIMNILNAFLSENTDTVCIITGYKQALKDNFFSMNDGLARRFTRWFEIKDYNAEDLRLIFFKIIREQEWEPKEDEIETSFFEKNKKYFKFNGGDMLNLFGYVKRTHGMRLLKIETEEELKLERRMITKDDIEKGMEMYIKNSDLDDRKEDVLPSFYT